MIPLTLYLIKFIEFQGLQESRKYRQIINACPDSVFPLLCPVREKDWLDGWEYEMIHSESGFAEKGCVFLTPHHGDEPTTWYVTEYDKEKYYIEFLRVSPGLEIVKINISLKKNGKNKTFSDIAYQYTALNEERNNWIKSSLDHDFKKLMLWLEKSMNYYLKTGKKLRSKI